MSIILFSSKYPLFSPNYTSQGRQDNCWLISTLIALSTKDKGREILKRLFTINDDNTYTIKLINDIKKTTYIKILPEFQLNATNELMYCGNGLGIPKLFDCYHHIQNISGRPL